jgi:dTDP-4-amino-4,6-dideoxygalactose transaminase
MKRIYLSPPDVGPAERELLLDAFDSGWIAPLGPHVDAFEREMAAAVGVPYAVALSSGTAALDLGLHLLGVGRMDEVITSTLTFAATANAICYQGASPVFLDVSRDSWNLDPDLLEEELGARNRQNRLPAAVVPVDLYGQCADYARIIAACERFGVPVLEDAAEALGASYRGRAAGGFGECAAFSFNGNKIITTSGGGMLVSHRSDIVERARYLSTQARQPAAHYEHVDIGCNYRLSNLLAAVGRGQLAALEQKIARRREINLAYRTALAGFSGISFMPEASSGRSNAWLTVLTIDAAAFGVDREAIRRHLDSRNVESRPVWKPMHMQPVFRRCEVRGGAVAEQLFRDGLCLPSGSSLSDDEQRFVIAGIEEARSRVPAALVG